MSELTPAFGAPFTADEDATIKMLYIESEAKYIAQELRRPLYSVQNRIRFLGLSKSGKRKTADVKKSVFLEPKLEHKARRLAKKAGLSMSAWIQNCVREYIDIMEDARGEAHR